MLSSLYMFSLGVEEKKMFRGAERKPFGIAYHGNNCGPGWSAGKYQSSSKEALGTAIDDFDRTCEVHDLSYANGDDLTEADLKFALENLSVLDPKRNFAGLLVGLQGLGRKTIDIIFNMTKNGKNKEQIKQLMAEIRAAASTKSKKTRKRNKATKLPPLQKLVQTSAAPSAISREVTMSKPSYKYRNGNVIITHSEYLGSVTSSSTAGAFSTQRYGVNPGLLATFPWLSQIASNYDRYRWKKLCFYYVPASSTSTAGRISLAYTRDPTQQNPISNTQVFQIVPNDEQAVWSPAEICINGSKTFFVRTSGTNLYLTNQFVTDLKTTDDGTLFVSTSLTAASTVVGEVYCYYEVELVDPVFNQAPLFSQLQCSSATAANLFNGATVTTGGIMADTSNANVVSFLNAGIYLFCPIFVGTGITNLALTVSATSGTGASVTINNSKAIINSGGTQLNGNYLLTVTADITGTCNMLVTLTSTTVTFASLDVTLVTGLGITSV
jgi:hypothetical protein